MDAAEIKAIEEQTVLFALLKEIYLRNPDKTLIESIRTIDPEEIENSSMKAALEQMKAYALASGTEEKDEKFLNLKRDWTKLFRGVSPVYGPKAPYGILHMDGAGERRMADLAALYIDGGYSEFQEKSERIDYIGFGFGYLSRLYLQIINAFETEDSVELKRLKLCERVFVSEYFLPWVGKFCEEAAKFAVTDFYKGVLELTKASMDSFKTAEVKETVTA